VTTAEFLARLKAIGVRVRADGTSLRCSAPEGVLTAALQEEIAHRKTEILFLLGEDGVAEMLPRPRLGRMPREGELPLSFAQERLWFLDQLEPGTSAYTIAGRRRLRGPLDLSALAGALTELVRRHESLRTTFVSRSGTPHQQIASPEPVTPQVIDLEGVPAADRERVAEDIVREEAGRPFTLARRPLCRPIVLRLGPEEHELVLVIHHIIVDGWSLSIIADEVDALYQAYATGRPSPLAELPVQYGDFALWQRQWLTGDVLEGQLRYWRKQMVGVPAPLELPADQRRSRQHSSAGASYDFELSRPLSESLHRLSRSEGATLFMTLLAGFKAVLCRWTGEEDIVLGTPVANRSHVEMESIVGLFANTLALRTDLAGDLTFRQLLGRVREVSLGAYAHQDMPFEKLVEELQPERKLGQHPLFQISFVFQAPGMQGPAPGSGFNFVTVGSPFDLTLFVRAGSDGGLRATIEYKRDLFAPQTIARLAGHYRMLLEGVAADPDCRFSAVPLVTNQELRQMLGEWNETATEYPRDRSIHGLFADQVVATPDAVAVVFQGASLTYRELDGRANRVAHYLGSLGVGPERPVGVWMERSVEMVVALLGILKAGAAYAPLDLMAPPDRVAFMLGDANIDILLTQEHMLERLPAHGARPICLDVSLPSIATQPDTPPPDATTADTLAYILYTSGSTGDPKGVAVTHRNVIRLVRATDYARLGPDEVLLQLAPLSFDASTFEIWGALLNGGRLVVAPPGALSVDDLGRALEQHGVTTLWLTAGLFHQVVDQRVEVLRPLRQLLAGGDVLSVPHVRRVLAAVPSCRLVNGYGPTEGTTFSCCHSIRSKVGFERSVPIGRPVANTRVYVLDHDRHPVPIGVPGELWIAGDGVARGYINRPELTAERFVMCRLSETIEERLYRTGDVVRWLADGTLEFLGRRDNQVKLRDYRIELGEIEATLSRHPKVLNVAVAVRPGSNGEKRLVAYIVADGALAVRDLREFLRRTLPEYMVPAVFMMLDRLPLTSNGKVDRPRLPEPEDGRERTSASEPRDEVERQLVRIWEEVLPVSHIGTRDSFFDLGGHSLLAVRMFARLEERFRIRLPLATLFQAPTIEGLAEIIQEGGRSASWRSLVAIQPKGSRPPLFAVPGIDGNVLCYSDLARFMVPEQPFYGLQSRGLDGTEKPLTRIEDIAAAFLGEIREAQPEGPYNLVGMCIGGVVAYEMAQQLLAAGQEVGLLILLETWPPMGSSRRLLQSRARLLTILRLIRSRFRLYAEALARLDARQRLKYLLGRLRMVSEMIAQRDVFRGDRSQFYLDVVTQANLVAYQQYEPRIYSGRAVFFRAEGRRVSADDDHRLAWRQLITGGLEIHTVPGDDAAFMVAEPHVQVLARQMKRCIDVAAGPPPLEVIHP
jgi:amino acid adenylation domain-containing protein